MRLEEVEMNNIIRLYRNCSSRDQATSYILTSRDITQKGIDDSLREIISHELSALTGRGVYYSISTKLNLTENYAERNPQNNEIRYVDIDLDNIFLSILAIHPIYNRDYFMNMICCSNEILENGYVLNPATNRKHSLLGIINYSQRTVSGWANSMGEVMLQCNGLELKELSTIDSHISSERTEELLKDYFLKELEQRNVERFRRIIKESYEKANLRRRILVDRVNTNKWYKS